MKILGVIGILIVASVIGYAIFKFALGLLAAIMVGVGIFIGYYFCVLFPPKSLRKRLGGQK